MTHRHQFSDLARAVARLEQILAARGIEITDPAKSPFKRAEGILREMDQTHLRQRSFDNTVDYRENWRKAFSLGDLALKLVAAHTVKPSEFEKLTPHLRYLARDTELSLCSFTRGGHSGSVAEQENDFIAELRLAACCVLMMDDLEFDPPTGKKKTKGKNPDIVGRFNGRKWAIEGKTLHPDRPGAEQSPEAFFSRVIDARDQIKKAIADGRAETGVVIVNMKNTVDPDSFLPAQPKDGDLYYGSHENLPLAVANLTKKYNQFITPIAETLKERQFSIPELLTDPEKGGDPKIVPCVIATYFVIDGIVKDGKPTLTMLRSLQIDPEPNDQTGEALRFAQKLNACMQDDPEHVGDQPIGTREDWFKWAQQYGPMVVHEQQDFNSQQVPSEWAEKVREFEASGKEMMEWEEVDAQGNKVVKLMRRSPTGAPSPEI